MKTKKFIILSLFLVLLFSIAGAVSATEDITTDQNSADISVTDISSDIITEESNTNINEIENTNENIIYVDDWDSLKSTCEENKNSIGLINSTYTIGKSITLDHNVTIIGDSESYITGGSLNKIPFICEDPSLTITFKNIKFVNVTSRMVIQLAGTTTLENCSFDNIQTASGRNAVVYNTEGFMNIVNCNFTNCSTGYGVISNYNQGSVTAVRMNVTNSRFENNYASVEPGAINNCGLLNVTSSEFINNSAAWWAGAIHTHTNAETVINYSNFTDNTAGWNGGALYTYSRLTVSNSRFTGNKCHTSAGGGAIGCSNYGSSYNITINNCTFEENANLCGNTNETPSTGTGGAISAMNSGILKVYNSTFIHNTAAKGQAIAAYSQGYENITAGTPKVIILNNVFINHTATNTNTVNISGDYIFENNTFINSVQNNLGNNIICTSINDNLDVISLMINNIEENTEVNAIFEEETLPTVLYINSSSTNTNASGIDWENAIGGSSALNTAIKNIADNGTIYAASGKYKFVDRTKSYTIIGQENTYLTNNFNYNSVDVVNTFVNIIFDNEMGTQVYTISREDLPSTQLVFKNCTFTTFKSFKIGSIYEFDYNPEEGWETTFGNTIFENCVFDKINDCINIHKWENVEFKNCTFRDTEIDALINSTSIGYVKLSECNFENCKVNGIVKAANVEDIISIEDCTYDFEATTDVVSSENRYYLNATKLKVTTVDTNIAIGEYANNTIVITLTDVEGNPIANTEIKYTLNGEEATGITNDEGKVNVPVNIIGDVTLTTQFIGNDAYNPSEATTTFNIPKVKTTLTVSSMTKYYGSSKKLSVTLKDENGNALAGETVTITINGKKYTGKTNSNGVASFAINNAKGTYKVNVNYAGTTTYDAVSKDITVKVVKPIMKAVSTKVKKGKYFQVSIKTYNKKAIKNIKKQTTENKTGADSRRPKFFQTPLSKKIYITV